MDRHAAAASRSTSRSARCGSASTPKRSSTSSDSKSSTSREHVDLTPAGEARALEVQALLVAKGHHRAPSVGDLLIAATAEAAGLTVLHVDKDFELIADVTGQPVERLLLD
ncbi:PIN domain-containing protein [Paramicrobacterium humi]|uniref:PIN domain-containing protein n=1 Tax=Paramicrobacterium humi TaxID=640635 RepID=UPI003182FFF4